MKLKSALLVCVGMIGAFVLTAMVSCAALQPQPQPVATLNNPSTQPIVVNVTIPPQSNYNITPVAATQPSGITGQQVLNGLATGVQIGASIPSPIQPYLFLAGTILGLFGIGGAATAVVHANKTNAATVQTMSDNHTATVSGLTTALTAATQIAQSMQLPKT